MIGEFLLLYKNEKFHGMYEMVSVEMCCSKCSYSHEMIRLMKMHEMWKCCYSSMEIDEYVFILWNFIGKRNGNCDHNGKNCVEELKMEKYY